MMRQWRVSVFQTRSGKRRKIKPASHRACRFMKLSLRRGRRRCVFPRIDLDRTCTQTHTHAHTATNVHADNTLPKRERLESNPFIQLATSILVSVGKLGSLFKRRTVRQSQIGAAQTSAAGSSASSLFYKVRRTCLSSMSDSLVFSHREINREREGESRHGLRRRNKGPRRTARHERGNTPPR